MRWACRTHRATRGRITPRTSEKSAPRGLGRSSAPLSKRERCDVVLDRRYCPEGQALAQNAVAPVSPELECRNFLTNLTGGLVFCHELFPSYKAVGVICPEPHETQGRDVQPVDEQGRCRWAGFSRVGVCSHLGRRLRRLECTAWSPATCRVPPSCEACRLCASWDGRGRNNRALDEWWRQQTEIVARICCRCVHQVPARAGWRGSEEQ